MSAFEIVIVALGAVVLAAAACWTAVALAHWIVRHHGPREGFGADARSHPDGHGRG